MFCILKVTSEELEHRHLVVTIEVDEERVQRALRATARRISRQSPVRGYRPGRAPLGVVMRRVGKEVMYDALVDDIGDTLFQEALEELDVKPAAKAQLDDVQLEPLVLKLTVPLEPIVELGEYQAVRIEPPVVSVSDEQVEEALTELQERNAQWELVTRPAQLGDLAVVALRGTNSEGVELINEERTSFRLSLDSPLPTLHEQLLEMEADEEREFDFTYPADFADPTLAGQSVHFWILLSEVRERVVPGLDDEWAKTVGDYESLEDLRLTLRERLEEQAERQAEQDYASQVVTALVDQAQIDYPEELVQNTLDRMLTKQDMALRRRGLDLDLFLRMEDKTRKQLREEQYDEAEERLRRFLALSKVVELEEVEVEPLEVVSYIRMLSSAYGDQAEEMRRTMLASESFQESVRQDLLVDKGTTRLVLIARGEVELLEEVTTDVEESDTEEEAPELELVVETEEAATDMTESGVGSGMVELEDVVEVEEADDDGGEESEASEESPKVEE